MYQYLLIPFEDLVRELVRPASVPADSYRSDDIWKMPVANLLAQGFRWVRTDGGYAVLERETANVGSGAQPSPLPARAGVNPAPGGSEIPVN